jgi:hypothetical protein
MITVKERTQLPVRWTIVDHDGVNAIPVTMRYRVDCVTTSVQVLDWQTLNPSSPVDFTIPASAHVIQDDTNLYEIKRLTIEANAGLDNQISDIVDYGVQNNEFEL